MAFLWCLWVVFGRCGWLWVVWQNMAGCALHFLQRIDLRSKRRQVWNLSENAPSYQEPFKTLVIGILSWTFSLKLARLRNYLHNTNVSMKLSSLKDFDKVQCSSIIAKIISHRHLHQFPWQYLHCHRHYHRKSLIII